jgi:hypothetical protein
LYLYNSFDFSASLCPAAEQVKPDNYYFNGELDSEYSSFSALRIAAELELVEAGATLVSQPCLATPTAGLGEQSPGSSSAAAGADSATQTLRSPWQGAGLLAAGQEHTRSAPISLLDQLFNSISAPATKMCLREPYTAEQATNPNNCSVAPLLPHYGQQPSLLVPGGGQGIPGGGGEASSADKWNSAERAPIAGQPYPNPNSDNDLNSGKVPGLKGGSQPSPLRLEAKQEENLTSPYIFKFHINKLSEAIKEEIEKSGKIDPYNPYKLVNASLKAGNIDEKEFKILNNLLENNKFDEFNFKRIGWNYLKDFNKIVILDNKIYVTEVYAKYLMTSDQITEAQNNSIFYAPKIKYSFPAGYCSSSGSYSPLGDSAVATAAAEGVAQPLQTGQGYSSAVVKEVENTAPIPDKYRNVADPASSSGSESGTAALLLRSQAQAAVKEKYLFYSTVTDLLNSDSREKIDIRNKTIVPFDKTSHAQQ